MNKKVRCAIYDRVSHDLQVQGGLSLVTQKELLTEYALSKGYEIVDYYVDEGITARKKLQNRKDFMRLLEDVKKDKIDIILVTKLDRWFRNVKDYHNTQSILEAHNCNWRTVLEDYDTSTADGQLKINIMLAVAQNECDRTSERIKVVFEHKRRNGEHLTGKPSFGYRIKNKKLVKDENTSRIVEEFFSYYLSCFSKRKTILHILEVYGPNAPSPQMMDKMTKKEVYCGRRGTDLNYCDPYITPEQFELIQKVCSSKTYSGSNERYIFSQLMKCPYCGATMTGFVKKHKLKNGQVNRYKRYRCSKKFDAHPSGICISESVIEEYMLNHVCEGFHKKMFEIKSIERKKEKKNRTASIRSELDRLNIQFQKGRISETYYDEQYIFLEEKLKKNLEEESETVADYAYIQEVFSGDWKEVYEKLDAEHKNTFWKRIIKEIHLDRETHTISGFSFLPHGCSK